MAAKTTLSARVDALTALVEKLVAQGAPVAAQATSPVHPREAGREARMRARPRGRVQPHLLPALERPHQPRAAHRLARGRGFLAGASPRTGNVARSFVRSRSCAFGRRAGGVATPTHAR